MKQDSGGQPTRLSALVEQFRKEATESRQHPHADVTSPFYDPGYRWIAAQADKHADELAAVLQQAERDESRLLADMHRANALVNDASDGMNYQIRMVALALIARQFLREHPPATDPAAALAAPAVPQQEQKQK